VSDALQGANLEALLANEEQLVAAMADVGRLDSAMASPELREELALARTSLEKCRRLGAVVRQLGDACLVAQGRGGEYSRTGSSTGQQPRGAGVQARV
jgi:hypothetical protein